MGTRVDEGSRLIAIDPWTLVGRGAAMSVTIIPLNFLGNGLRDAFDPQLRNESPDRDMLRA